jgi:hypothetical protein
MAVFDSPNAASDAPYWLEAVPHRGRAAYHRNGDAYPVFRNVKNYGAVGDGVADDTAAIMCAASVHELREYMARTRLAGQPWPAEDDVEVANASRQRAQGL